jgi:glycerol-3-phosphate acyltransferase PlsY
VNSVAAVLALVPFYLLGAFPTGYLVARLYGVDITGVGSGNVGATNVARSVGKKAGIITLGLDVLKGALAVWIAYLLSDVGWFQASCGVAVVCGHCFSIPGYLKGGKGVATALGVLIALTPPAALVAIATFGILFFARKIVSLASLGATLAVPAFSLIVNAPDYILIAQIIMASILTYRHRENVQRLIEGREPRFTSAKN